MYSTRSALRAAGAITRPSDINTRADTTPGSPATCSVASVTSRPVDIAVAASAASQLTTAVARETPTAFICWLCQSISGTADPSDRMRLRSSTCHNTRAPHDDRAALAARGARGVISSRRASRPSRALQTRPARRVSLARQARQGSRGRARHGRGGRRRGAAVRRPSPSPAAPSRACARPIVSRSAGRARRSRG